MKRRAFAALALGAPLALAVALSAGCSDTEQAGPEPGGKLVFTAIPGEKATQLKDKFDKLAVYLTDRLGVDCEYRAAKDYGASVSMFRNGDIQLAWYGGLTGVQAREGVSGARAIAQGSEDPAYYSYFIAHESVGIEATDTFPAAIADLPFTFGSKLSTSGRLMPESFIRANTGKSPADFFTSPVGFSGAHPKTVEAVKAGTAFKAGAVSYTTYDAMVASGEAAGTKVIWKTPLYADYNWTAHPDLESRFGAGFIDKVQAALIELDDQEILREGFARTKLIPATNEDFERIRETAIELGFLETD